MLTKHVYFKRAQRYLTPFESLILRMKL